ncbi:MAG TPA: alpha-L-arabinofuranosidase, partial [Porphyromonadaceae bacterium]|nr:alpha-L-arabinofuranosidase [Porphyromonadaceae bacterium]
ITGQQGLYASAVIDTKKKEIIIKLSNVSEESRDLGITLEGLKKKTQLRPEARTILLKGDRDQENTLDNPRSIVPISSSATLNGSKLSLTVEPYSFNLFVIGYTD